MKAEDVYSPAITDWNAYRKCSQVCGALIGEPCRSLSGRIVNGRPDGTRTALAVPHVSRKRRTGPGRPSNWAM